MEKRFYRSRKEKKLLGVCAGVADYFEVDPTLVRLIWIVFTFAGGAGIVAYIIAAIIMPEEPIHLSGNSPKEQPYNQQTNTAGYSSEKNNEWEKVHEPNAHENSSVESGSADAAHSGYNAGVETDKDRNHLAIGVTLVIVGSLLFSRNFFHWHWINFRYMWPVILILVGVFLILDKRK